MAHTVINGKTVKKDDSLLGQNGQGTHDEDCLKRIYSNVKSTRVKNALLPVALIPPELLDHAAQSSDETKRSVGALDVLPSPLVEPLPPNYLDRLVEQAQQGQSRQRDQDPDPDMTRGLVHKLLCDLYDPHGLRYPINQK